MKKALLIVIVLFSFLLLAGCQETTEEKIRRLEKEAAESREEFLKTKREADLLEELLFGK